jgi:hypothetical protein
LEQKLAEPNADRLEAFREYLLQCNSPLVSAPSSSSQTATPGAPLLIPLDGSTSQ